jgi:hypothetical protein
MTVSIRSLCLAGSLALLAACQGQSADDNLADLDARLTNGADNVAAANEAEDANAAIAMAAAGGRIEKAPAAVETKAVAPQGRSVGDLVRQQASGQGANGAAPQGDCAKDVKTGPEWADRMPQAFRVYPGGKLVEAAGIDKERCTLRIISFTTSAGIDPVLDYYFTQAKRAGYDAEHLVSGGEHQLGGTNKGGAYVVFARRAGALTEVDIVANAN